MAPGLLTEGLLTEGLLTEGLVTEGLVRARTARKGLAAAAVPVVRCILHQPIGRNSALRMAPADLMGYKALPFYAARVVRMAGRTAIHIRTSRLSTWR